jgi:hypothetical protein
MTSLITDGLKFIAGIFHFGINFPHPFRKPGKRTIVFKNKFGCRDPYNAVAWLAVVKWRKIFIYPFECMDQCVCEAKSILYNHVIFDRERHPIQIGGYGFNSGLCKEAGTKWLGENFKLGLDLRKIGAERYISTQPNLSIRYDKQ